MAIDREARRQAADSLAAFMRGEITSLELVNGLETLGRSADLVVTMPHSAVWLENPKGEEHLVSVSQTTWQYLERVLALLETDLDCSLVLERKPSSFTYLMLVALIALMTCFLALSFFVIDNNWIAFAAGWCLGGTLTWMISAACFARVKNDRTTSYAPFGSEAQWQSHRELLKKFNLPEYDPVRHHRPVSRNRSRQGISLKAGMEIFLCVLIVPLLVALFLIQSPITSVVMIFDRDIVNRYVTS